MATWQPPIPAGALYSKAAMRLGAAVPLLAWCYDAVQRDGWVAVRLKDAAADMDVPYQTMKRWWALVREGPFFCEVIDAGHNGWQARFADAWIDWRILSARTPQVSPVVLEDTKPAQIEPQVHTKYTPSTHQVPLVILEETAYKEDILQETDLPVAAQPARRKRIKTTTEPTEHQALMAAYAEWLGYKIPYGGKEAAAAKRLLSAGYTIEQIERGYYDLKARPFYGDKHLSLQTVFEQIGAILNRNTAARKAEQARAAIVAQNGTHAAEPFDYDSLPNPNDERERRAAAGRAARQAALAARKAGTP